MCGQSTLEASAVDAVVDESNEKLDIALPDDLEVKSDRVGQSFVYADSAKVGETVRFNYTGGSEVGPRTVLVVKVDDQGLEGLTLERDGGYRRYDDSSIDGRITVVAPFVGTSSGSTTERRVRFDDAGVALLASLTGEQLAELYGQYVSTEGVGTKYDANTGEVVVELPEPSTSVKAVDNELRIVNKAGKTLTIYLYTNIGNEVGLHNDDNGYDNTRCTAEDIRDQLVEFLA